MKKINYILFSMSLFLIISCQYTSNEPYTELSKSLNNLIEKIEKLKKEKPRTYYVNVDKSGSKIAVDNNREFQRFKRCIQHVFQKPDDQIVIIHTYENSSNVSNFHRYTLNTPYPNLSKDEEFDKRQYKVAMYLRNLKKEKQRILTKIQKKHFEVPANAKASELLSSLYRFSTDIKKHGHKRAYYYLAMPDGVEYSNIRTFNAKSPKLAREQGLEDAKKLSKKFDVPVDAFQSLEKVIFQLPSDSIMDTTQQMNFVQEYWEEVFKYFGCPVTPDFGGCF